MWLFTVHGFYSIVQKGPGLWHVRAREKHDLENLKQLTKLRIKVEQSFPGSDYPWRMLVGKRGKDIIIKALGDDIEYDNFKSEVGRRRDQAAKLPAYHEIWAVMAHHGRGGIIR
ncbi:hypothetical protein [Prosthecobacter sp.]|uniref:hypothetical protein n=1 Tax=Prosthecobacter sp. TaxID=1965333 RepID=UPI0037852454